MRRFFSLTSAAVVASLIAGPALAQEWNMATPYGDGVFHTQNVRDFVADVAELTDGGLTITVHSGGSLIPHPSIKESIQDGVIEMGEVLISLLQNEDPLYGVDAIPFLATSYESAEALWAASRPAIEARLAEDGLTLLYAVPWQPQGFYTAEPLTAVSDFECASFRTYNAATARLAELMGAEPTQIEAADIPQAFATGIVEAMITSSQTGVSSQAWDFVGNFTDVRAWLPKNMIVVSTEAFEGLDEATRAALLEAAAEAEARGWEMSQALNAELIGQLEENGMTVAEPSESLAAELAAIGETMAGEWAEEAGEEGQAVLSTFRGE